MNPGTYTDTVLAKEQSWYAVELQEGQELTARSTLVIDDGTFGGIGALYEVQIVDPDLPDVCCGHGRGYEVNIGVGAASRTVSVSADSDVVGAKGSVAERAGRYYVRITSDGNGAGEYPVELDLSVTGAATATSAAAAPPSAAPPTEPGRTAEAGGPARSTLWGVIGGLSVLVIGLAVAVVALPRRDRARTRGRSA